jgi:hypothetical protein
MARTGEKYTEATRAVNVERAAVKSRDRYPSSPLSLFSPGLTRVHDGPAGHAEGVFAFVDRSAWPRCAAVRDELERWFARYPDEPDKNDLQRRFRSPDRGQHLGAWWELYLHQVFTSLGYAVELHPRIAGTAKRPDFLLAKGGVSILLEAVTTVSGIVDEAGRAAHREAELLDILDSVSHPDFSISVEIESVGPNTLKRKLVTGPLLARLNELDANGVRWESGSYDDEFVLLDQDGWRVTITPYLRGDRDDPAPHHRMIGMGPVTVGSIDDRSKLAAALESKRSRYGRPELPYVVAVLREGFSPDDEDAMSALVGTHALAYRMRGGPSDARWTRWTRLPDGMWLRGTQANHGEHVSAVLIGDKISELNFADQWPVLWPNPWASRPLVDDLPFAKAVISPGNLDKPTHVEGQHPACLLGIRDRDQ